MNRIELAAANCDLEPMTVNPAVPPVSVALWGLFIGAAAIAYAVGYTLGHDVTHEGMMSVDGTLDAPTMSELLAARRSA